MLPNLFFSLFRPRVAVEGHRCYFHVELLMPREMVWPGWRGRGCYCYLAAGGEALPLGTT